MTRIFVGNLSYQSTERELRSAFEQFGGVSSVQINHDSSTGRSRGFGFISMRKLDDADEAIARLNGSMLQGRRIVVSEAKGRPQTEKPAAESRWHLV